MRLSEIASMNFGLTPSFSATALPMSTSKPSMSPLCGFLKPNGGTSYLTPIAISPFFWILPIVVSAGNFSACWADSEADPASSSSSAATRHTEQRRKHRRDDKPARCLHPGPPRFSDG